MNDVIYDAEKFRRNFNHDICAPINVLSLAMELLDNLTIVWMPMLDEVSGCCYNMDQDNIIFINSNHSKGRQNFTLAHEIYHLLHPSKNEFIFCSDKNNNDDIEKKADMFASSLILPNSALYCYMNKNGIDSWSLKDIVKCEQYFQISHLALLKRLLNRNLIDKKQYEEFKPNIILNAKRFGFSSELYEPSAQDKRYYTIGNLIPLVEDVFEKDKISKGKRDEILFDAFRGDYVFNLNNGEDISNDN